MYIAVYKANFVLDYEEFHDLEYAKHFLEDQNDAGELYPICIYQDPGETIVWKYHWPNGRDMTDEEVKTHIDDVVQLRIDHLNADSQ